MTALTTPSITRAALPSARWLVGGILITATVALGIAVRAPLTTTVLGLVAFGVLHNVLEIRYVAGRFAQILTGRFLALLLIMITGIVLCRLAAGYVGEPARYAEVALGYLVLGYGCRYGLLGFRLVIALGVLAAAALVSFTWPGYHFVVLTHLHNLVPLFFLWEWASRLPTPAGRWGFRLAQVGWTLLVPVAIALGAVDALIRFSPGVVERFVGTGAQVVASSAPPGASVVVGTRFLVVFAFMQTMHYVVWVGFLPRFAPDAAAAFEGRVPWLRGRRVWALGLGGAAVLAVLFWTDYHQGKALYGALASYHAYLEFPVLLALIMGAGVLGSGRDAMTDRSTHHSLSRG